MSDSFPDVLDVLADELARVVSRRYRIEFADAQQAVIAAWQKDAGLIAAARRENRPERLMRTRAYKDASREAKRSLYYQLRRYRISEEVYLTTAEALVQLPHGASAGNLREILEPVLKAHVSTAERRHERAFLAELLKALGDSETIVDVGCGVLPLLFPFDEGGRGVRRYYAVDRDTQAMRVVSAYSRWRNDGRLIGITWDLEQGWSSLAASCGCQTFDIALMLKLVPVIQRLRPELLDLLAQVPSRRVLVTGARESMVKRQSIARRELGAIEDFAKRGAFRTVRSFRTSDEMGYVFERDAAGVHA